MDALRPLSLDQFAAMTAEMEAGFPRDRVLGDATVSAEQWELTQETWLLRMAKQGSQRKLALLDRYNDLLAKHRKSAQRKMRAEKRKLKGPMPVAPEAQLSPLARVRTDDSPGATFQRPGIPESTAPSWLSQAAAAAAPVAPGMIASPAPGVVGPPSMVATPSTYAAPSIVAAPVRLAENIDDTEDGGEGPTMFALPEQNLVKDTGPAWLQPKRPPSALSGTARLDEAMAKTPVIGPAWLAGAPAARSEDARPVPAPAPSSPAVPAAGPSWLNSSAATPFVAPQAPAPAAVAAPVAVAPPVAQPAAAAGRRPPRGGTLMDRNASDFLPPAAPAGPAWMVKAAQPAARDAAPRAGAGSADALPFQRAAAAAPAAQPAIPPGAHPAAARASVAAPPPAAAPAPVPVASPATPAVVQAAPAAAAPAAAAAAGAGPRLTIEQLAWLQAQVETSPELGRAAREKLGLGEAEYATERAFWQTRFQQDRGTVERYSQLFYHYKRGR